MGNVLQLKQLCSTLRQVQDSTDTEIESYKVSHTTHALLNYFINTKDFSCATKSLKADQLYK